MSYRTRVRTPSFAHLQQIPSVIRGSLVSDLIVYLGSIDFVMSDVGPLTMHDQKTITQSMMRSGPSTQPLLRAALMHLY